MKTRRLSFKSLIIAVFLPLLVMAGAAWAQTGAARISQEYFVQQSAGEHLFIRINGFEAEVFSLIRGQDGQELMLSGVPGSRLLPVFQYVDEPDSNRQLDIQVFSDRYTNRSEFGLELTRLDVWDERSRAVSRAYRLLAVGMLQGRDIGSADWTVRVESLINAGRLFEQFGMMEMRLWSNYLAAYLVQYQLQDFSIAYSMTRDILAELKGARFRVIELATLQLQGAALIGLKRTGGLSVTASDPDPVQTALTKAAALAESMGYHLEQALALKASGEEYAADAYYPGALEAFRQAVGISTAIADGELSNEIRESMIKIHALEGDTRASSEELQKIETQLQTEGSKGDLALNLLAQGRIKISNFQYGQAVNILSRALENQNDSAVRTRINYELARAFFEQGRLEEAEAYLKIVGVTVATDRQSRSGSVIDAGRAYGMLAHIHRINGQFEAMRRAREIEGGFHSGEGFYLYERGLDEIAVSGLGSTAARALFRQSFETSSRSADLDSRDLARLQFCAADTGGEPLCRPADTRLAYQRLVASGIPRNSTQAMFLMARILVADGRIGDAIDIMNGLVDEIHMLHSQLPGVLGSWYRERHEQVFEFYLELLSRTGGSRDAGDDLSSLLVLSKIRYIEGQSGAPVAGGVAGQDSEQVRTRLAQLAAAAPGARSVEVQRAVSEDLAGLRNRSRQQLGKLSRQGLLAYLDKLKKSEVVLTYHISPTTAQVWVASKSGVRRRNIPNAAYIFAALDDARDGLDDLGLRAFDNKMDALGERLLEPVADLLRETIYWIPAGALLGFPLDALRLDGRYLVQDHTVVNLLSFPRGDVLRQRIESPRQQNVFLAGYPQDYSGEYATRLRTSPEIQAVTDMFVGPGLTIVQGAALLPDEFGSEKLAEAALVHLAIPGTIDLRYPEQSELELSGFEGSSGRAKLHPYDIRSLSLQAKLVVLSATRLKQRPTSAFISHPGLISEFAGAGADYVIARTWVSGGSAPLPFLEDFYRRLEISGNVQEALAKSKGRSLARNREDGLYDWAGFQLFVK